MGAEKSVAAHNYMQTPILNQYEQGATLNIKRQPLPKCGCNMELRPRHKLFKKRPRLIMSHQFKTITASTENFFFWGKFDA
jgi:hypothetical protein